MKKNLKIGLLPISLLSMCSTPLVACNNVSVANIEVTTKPKKVEYAKGEYLALDGLVVSIVYSNGTKKITTDYTLDIDPNARLMEKGNKTITVLLNNSKLTTTFQIKVGEAAVSKLVVKQAPTKQVYSASEQLVLDGLVVKAIKTDDSVDEDFKDYTTEPVDGAILSEWGRNTITIKHKDKIAETSVLVLSQPVEFSTCDWKAISDWTYFYEIGEITEQTICEHFLINGVQISALTDLIGQSRKILMNGQEHNVKVIGVNHDTIDEEEALGKKAALTFQFFNKASWNNGVCITSSWENTTVDDYINSQIRYNLNKQGNKKNVSWDWPTSNYSLFEMLPAEFDNYIWTVKKQVATRMTGESNFTVRNYSDRLFLLTLTEYNQTDATQFMTEGLPYDYWKTHESASDRVITSTDGSEAGRNKYYWTATPCIASPNASYHILGNGSFTTGMHGYPGAISPCFCI